MTQAKQIIILSPSAHYPSHNWPITVALMRALRRKGWDFRTIIFSTGAEPVPSDFSDRVEPVFVRPPKAWRTVAAGNWQNRRFGGLMNVCETLACLYKGLRTARKTSNPVFHIIGGSYWVFVLAALFFWRCRFIYSLFGEILSGPVSGPKAVLRKCAKKLLRHATATGRLDFTCENEFLRESIGALVGNHVRLVPNAIDDEAPLPSQAEARLRLKLPPDEKIILFFGTHRREKDYVTPLKGCLTLADPPLAYFVGKVISENDPNQVVADCHYPKAKIVNEFVPEEMTKYYFAAADAVVLPYEAGFAKGSGVLIQCCQHLRPMIASATPYFSAFVARYQCGVNYVPSDSVSFAAAAQQLLSASTNYRAALERARRDHSWNAAVNQYIEMYEDLPPAEMNQAAGS